MLTKDKEDKLIEIFIAADDFCQDFQRWLDTKPKVEFKVPRFEGRMEVSEILSIIVFYHYSGYKCFQYYYEQQVQTELTSHFPNQVSYKRFLQLISKSTVHLFAFSKWMTLTSEATSIYYIDSKKLPVCHNRRIHNHKVFKDIAERGKTSTGWFYGLKVHMVINNLGQIMSFTFTTGSVSDSNPEVLRTLLTKLQGNCYGDKGYLSRIFEELYEQGLKLVTKIRKNMKNKLMPLNEKYQMFKRGVIESVFDILMTVFDIDHTRHRSPRNAMSHMLGALAAYSFMDQKPSVWLPKLLQQPQPHVYLANFMQATTNSPQLMMTRYLSFFLFLITTSALTGQTDDQWDLLITDVQVFTGEKTLKATDLGVKDGIITHLGPELDRQHRARNTINGKGYTVLPGLVNTHVHAWFPLHLQQAAQAGVLATCDMHGSAFATKFLGQFQDSVGYARYYAAGSGATVPGGHGTQFGMIVPTIDSTTSARQFTLDRIAEGADYIKILREPMRPTLSFEQIDTIIKTAHEKNVRVVAHVSRCADAVELVRLGIDGLVHIWFDRAMTEEELKVFEQHEDLFIVPTTLTNIKVFAFFEQQAEKPEVSLDSIGLLDEIRRLHEAGVQILAGTDPPNFGINHGSDLNEELILLAAAGIPNQACLAGATVESARYFGLAGPQPIEVGVAADFFMVKGDPLKSMEALRELEGVWQKGQRIYPVQKR